MSTERQLMRLLHGELEAGRARELEDRLERDGELRARYRRLGATWECLGEPPAAPIPDGFAARVMAGARCARVGELSWSLAPAWARAGSLAALLAGLVLGASFGAGAQPAGVDLAEMGEQEAYVLSEPLSLAESYWLNLEADNDPPAAGDNGEERVQ